MAKKKPAKRKPAKRTPRKRAKRKPAKKKEKKKGGIVSRVIGKIPTSYRVKGGKSKYKSKYGESEVEYEEVEVKQK